MPSPVLIMRLKNYPTNEISNCVPENLLKHVCVYSMRCLKCVQELKFVCCDPHHWWPLSMDDLGDMGVRLKTDLPIALRTFGLWYASGGLMKIEVAASILMRQNNVENRNWSPLLSKSGKVR